jgi:signal transduction histidine kinase
MLASTGKGDSQKVDLCRKFGATLILQRPQPNPLPTVPFENVPTDLAHAGQSAVLAERNRLAGEIHDGLAQVFTVICMHLGVAEGELSAKEGDPLCSVQRALELANFGLAEARRLAHKLGSNVVDETGLAVTLRRLVECSSVPGRLRCDFRSNNIPENGVPPRVQHELLRVAQEAIHNAVRHAGATVIAMALQWDAPKLVLEVKDNGSGISRLQEGEGFGLRNMRERASEIDGGFEIQTGAGQGTAIIVTVPISPFQLAPGVVGRWNPRSVGLRRAASTNLLKE